MPPSPRVRHDRSARRLLSTALLGCVALVAAACGVGEPQPTEYGEVNDDNDGYYGNFMFGCTGVEANEDGEYVDWTLENPDFCTCVFRGLKEENVPFAEMQEFEEAQAEAADDEDIPLPENVDEIRITCGEDDAAFS